MHIQDQLRAAGVTRWHIVETTRPQNLAEHQFNVAMIARRLGVLMGLITTEQAVLVVKALVHDQHEIFDGDVPSSTKTGSKLPHDRDDRIVQLADKMEALWFIQHRHVDRPDVVLDCQKRLREMVVQLSTYEQSVVKRVASELELGNV